MLQPRSSSPPEPPRRRSSSLTSCTAFNSLSLNASLSIYPWLMCSTRIINGDYLNLNLLISPSLFAMSPRPRWLRWQPQLSSSLLQFSIPPLMLACVCVLFFFLPSIYAQHWASAVKKKKASLFVCVCSGRSNEHCSARRQQLCLDRRHFQPMVVHGRLRGGEKKCLREKHVCVWPS